MMKTTKLSLCVSMVGLLATLPAAYANEIVTNCTQVSAVDGGDTNTANNESCAKLMIPLDYGDAPDPSFNTLEASGGARHQLGTSVYLGQCVDGDSGLLQGAASADDADKGSPEYGTCTDTFDGDEDGVAIAELHVGDSKNTVQVTANAACKLNAWVDWNQDGSWGGAGEQVFIDQVLSAGKNDLTMDVPAFAAEGTIYTRFRCSTVGGDGIGGEAADGEVEDYKLTILPAVPKIPVAVGDKIWIDADKNGKQDAGELPLAGAIVTLLDTSGNPAKDQDGNVIAPITTGADGLYGFTKLPEGDYSIRVQAPEGYIPTSNAGDVDEVVANDDSNCSVMGGNVQTASFTLMAGTEPASGIDGDGDNSNLTVDCGFYQPTTAVHSIGNMVWVDDGAGDNTKADNGQFDEGEGLLSGIKLELHDTTGAVIDSTMTSGGYYLFSGLNAGEYQVCVAAANFKGVGKLVGYTAGVNGKEADANTGGDSNDNGGELSADGICSNFIVLNDQEPSGELPTALGTAGDDGMGTEDNRSNLTVDFTVLPPAVAPTPVSVGDRIWIDTNENGQQDKDEIGLENATVTLLDKSGNPVTDLDGKAVGAITTAADGLYLFDNLPQGEYLVRVVAPEGYINTQGGADVDADASNTDSNCQVVDGQTQTNTFNLTTDNLTVDCGFYQPKEPTHSLGNRVWIDKNNNGLADEGELPASAGVSLELKGVDGAVISSTATDATGRYLFSGLAAGSYQVCVVAENFAAGNILEGYTASIGGNVADANTDMDGDDNGTDDIKAGLCSNLVVLDGKEPTGEASATGADGNDGMGTDDNRSNLSIDFGIVPPVVPPKVVSVGDFIWIDTNENGQQDKDEIGLENATVTLLDKSGNPVNDVDGKPVPAVTTMADGLYLFDNLPEGEYLIRVAAPEGYITTKGGAAVNDDASNTDSNCQAVDGQMQTSAFNLNADNLTVDCGFYQPKAPTHSVGNTVWVDANNNGLFDKDEQPIVDGVVMELLDKSGTVMAYAETKDGYYLFSGLAAGEYSVCVAHGNFDQGLLKGYTPSTGGDEADVNIGTDNADNGDNDTQDGLCSGVIILDNQSPTGELPTADGKAGDDGMGTDDNRSNLTLDFGVVPPEVEPPKTVSVGDFIWVDANENGQQDKDEIGMQGAVVTLLDKSGKPVSDADGVTVAAVTTGASGQYLFDNLPEGEYLIRVDVPNAYLDYRPTQSVADVNAADNDSNCSSNDGIVQTGVFNLTTDNTSVDCGFYQPKVPTHSIGNMVWVDNGAGENADNGRFDAGETLPNNVVMELRDSTGALVNSTQTANGYYLFNGLTAGEYQVCVAGSNFNEGAALDGFTASTAAKEDDANANGDSNNNGDSSASDGLCSNLIVLDDKEPTSEQPTASGIAGDDGMETEDNRSNLTVDFTVVPVEPVTPGTPVAVGNQIWIDSNANGEREASESFLENAVVTLTDASGRAVTDLDGNSVQPHTTGADGLYLFDNLPEGEYIVTVEPPEGFFPTIGGIDVDDDASDTDSNCRVNPINTTIETHPFTLTAGAEPDADGDDVNGNMTVDCGFYGSVSLGDKIWLDSSADGQQNNAEPGISGVSVSLLEADGITPATDISGKPVAAVMTDANGNYLFQNLKPGNYIVVVNPGADSGYSLTKGGADPDTDPSNTDSNCKVVEGRFQTPAVTLTPGAESYGNGFSDLSVDCGLFRSVNLGSRLWLDLDGDGKQSGGEPGIPGATVTLLTVDGKPVLNIFGDVLQPQTTDADGKYFFGNLREGDYIVKVVPPAGYLPTVGGNDPNDDDTTDSNGILAPDGSLVSKPINLKWGDEPEDGGATNTTVGFGLVANLHVPTLSQWGVAIMSMLLATAAFFRRRRED